jgi:hypothetical protein
VRIECTNRDSQPEGLDKLLLKDALNKAAHLIISDSKIKEIG